MPRSQPYARIAITLPQEDLAAADALAVTTDRSRSWIIAEALRQYVTARAATEAVEPRLDASRREQLRRDMQLSAEERVHAAEAALDRQTGFVHDHVRAPITFADFDAFRAWLDAQATVP
jgi:hypothetical protein